ncbi:MAG: hypothetical protein IJB41_01810, partial [Clostridia bacterium]|nr:hypothetical protein [Clostridia bacterium]
GAEPPPGLPVELFFKKSSTGNGRISRRKGRDSVQIDDSVKRLGMEEKQDLCRRNPKLISFGEREGPFLFPKKRPLAESENVEGCIWRIILV